MGLFAALLATTGCDESVDPLLEPDYPFTIWGFMNSGADTQYVRVFPITGDLIPSPAPLAANVFSTNLTTGERREWTYKLVQFDSLITGHLFWAPFRAEYGHRYRLEVQRPDGETSSTEVTVPPPVDFEIDISSDGVQIPIRLHGEIPNLIGLRVTYYATNIPPSKAWPPNTSIAPPVSLPVTVVYDRQVEQSDDDLWELTINMARDFLLVQYTYQQNCLITGAQGSAPNIWLRGMEFSTVAADSSWSPPGGVFNPNVLAVPGTFSNVNNGYGFFGAGQGIRHTWTPPVATSQAAGFDFGARCTGLFATETPDCMNPPVPCLDDSLGIWEFWLR